MVSLATKFHHDQAETPAPGAYKSENVHPQKEPKAPAYSMGARTEQRTNDVTPAPTSYNLGNTVGSKTSTLTSAPSVSISGRTTKGIYYGLVFAVLNHDRVLFIALFILSSLSSMEMQC